MERTALCHQGAVVGYAHLDDDGFVVEIEIDPRLRVIGAEPVGSPDIPPIPRGVDHVAATLRDQAGRVRVLVEGADVDAGEIYVYPDPDGDWVVVVGTPDGAEVPVDIERLPGVLPPAPVRVYLDDQSWANIPDGPESIRDELLSRILRRMRRA